MCGLKAAQKYLGDVLCAHILTVGVMLVFILMVVVALVMW